MKEVAISEPILVWDNNIEERTTEYSIAEIKAKGHNRFEGWSCMVGMDCLYIDFDGMVWNGPCRVGGPLGHMLTDWQLSTEMTTCTRQTCDCGTGIKLHKHLYPARLYPIKPQLFNVQWDLSRRCNFDCSYCWPSSHNKTDQWVPVEALIGVTDRINARIDRTVQYNFAGGEPTLHPGFLELCEHIHWEQGHYVHVQTNGTMSKNTAMRLSSSAEISISVHFEFVNMDKLVRNITGILDGANGGLEIKMMLSPQNTHFQMANVLKQRLQSVPNIEVARIIMTPLRDPVSNDLMGYSEEQLAEFGDVRL